MPARTAPPTGSRRAHRPAPPREEEQRPDGPDEGAVALLESYLKDLHVTRNLSEYTLRNYRSDIVAFLAWLASAKIAPLAATRQDLRRYLGELGQANVARASLTRKVSTIHTFYRFLELREHIERDPFYGMSGPKKAKRLPKVLEPGDIEQLLDAPPDDTPSGVRDRAILELLYAGGLRVGELAGLDTQDLDLEHRIVVVRGKGNKQRGVLIGRPARQAVARYLKAARPKLIGSSKTGPHRDALFLNKTGGRLSTRSVQAIVRKWATAAGIPAGAHPHLLRHSFATHMLDNGAELRVVQELLGHTSANTTQIYLDVTTGQQRAEYDAAFFNQLRDRKNDDD
jgi:site-specific recombinase XerD